MRNTVQRFMALALALALLFGSVNMASAQDANDLDEDPETSGTIELEANSVGSISIDISQPSVDFGNVDAFGQGSYDANVSVCQAATDALKRTRYGYDVPTVITVTSTTPWELTVNKTNDGSGNRFLVSQTAACTGFEQINGFENSQNIPGNDVQASGDITSVNGDPLNFFWGVDVQAGAPEIQDLLMEVVFTGEAII